MKTPTLWFGLLLAICLCLDCEFLHDLCVALLIIYFKGLEEAAPLAHHYKESSSGVVVLGVLFKVIGQKLNPLGEKADLDLLGAGVGIVLGAFLDDILLLSLG